MGIIQLTNKILIKNGIIVTMDPQRKMIEDGGVAIEGNKIIAVGKTDDVAERSQRPIGH